MRCLHYSAGMSSLLASSYMLVIPAPSANTVSLCTLAIHDSLALPRLVTRVSSIGKHRYTRLKHFETISLILFQTSFFRYAVGNLALAFSRHKHALLLQFPISSTSGCSSRHSFSYFKLACV